MPMDRETRDHLGKIVSARLEALRFESELLDEIYNNLGSPVMKSPTLAEFTKTPESIFLKLAFTDRTGDKLGPYATTTEPANKIADYQNALNILKQNNATIQKRFMNPGYKFSYWIYNDTIYRQTTDKKQRTTPSSTVASAKTPDSLFSYDLLDGIKWEKAETAAGNPSIKALAFQNENNPAYQQLYQKISALDNKERYPFWITRDYIGRQRPKNWTPQ